MNNHSVIRRLYENGVITIAPLHRHHGKQPENLSKRDHKKDGSKEKNFKLTATRKRLIECSAIRLFLKRKYSLKFATLTFSCKVDHKEANKCLSKFLDNLKKTYECSGYVITKELHQSGNPHYHIIIDIKFVDFFKLNNSWCSACSNIMSYSNCAFRTHGNSIIKSMEGLVKYITKYISKASEIELSKTRNYFIDQQTLSKSKIIDYNDFLYLMNKFKVGKTIVKDNFSVICLRNFNYLPETIIKDYKKVKIPPKIPNFINSNFDFYENIPKKVNVFYNSRA